MPPFSPFPGIRYADRFDPAAVTAPPYDVVDEDDRAALVARSDRNAVLFDLPVESDGADRYTEAAATFDAWRADGTLVTDDRPTFTVYRMTYTDDRGRPARTLGVIGALALSRPDEGAILPHEHTTPKAKTDRLDLLPRHLRQPLRRLGPLPRHRADRPDRAPGPAPRRVDRRRRRGPRHLGRRRP